MTQQTKPNQMKKFTSTQAFRDLLVAVIYVAQVINFAIVASQH